MSVFSLYRVAKVFACLDNLKHDPRALGSPAGCTRTRTPAKHHRQNHKDTKLFHLSIDLQRLSPAASLVGVRWSDLFASVNPESFHALGENGIERFASVGQGAASDNVLAVSVSEEMICLTELAALLLSLGNYTHCGPPVFGLKIFTLQDLQSPKELDLLLHAKGEQLTLVHDRWGRGSVYLVDFLGQRLSGLA